HAKEVLAYEVTAMIHNKEEAEKAQQASRALFAGGDKTEDIPSVDLLRAELGDGLEILNLLEKAGLIPSKSEGRRLVQQGGIEVDGKKVTDIKAVFTEDEFKDGALIVKKGKKVYRQIKLV
ncbi:MAG: S4 domain-containing protein, partial [Eubacterium sp.]